MHLIIGIFLTILLISPPPLNAAPKASLSKKEAGKKTPPRFLKGDQAFRERRDPKKGRTALEEFRALYKKNSKDYDAAWRVAMACYFVGIRLTKDEDKKAKLYAEGRDAGQAGAKLNKKCAACHFWAAINMALYGQTVGVFKMLFSLNEVRKHLKDSIEADPGYAFAGAYRLNGLIYQKLPGIIGGSNSKAKKELEKAIHHGPNEPLNYLFMARLLEEEYDDRKAALEFARRGLKVPKPTPDRIEAIDAIRDIKEFIKNHPENPQ